MPPRLALRQVRIRMLTYNSGLPMFCAVTIEATLSETGVMRPTVNAYAFAVQEYLPASEILTRAVEILFIVWSCLQLLNEIPEFFGGVRDDGFGGGSLAYFSNVRAARSATGGRSVP